MQNIDISEFLVANNIKTEKELMAKAQEQFAKGKKDLKKYIPSKSPKGLQDFLTGIRKMEKVASNTQKQEKRRMQIISESLKKECQRMLW